MTIRFADSTPFPYDPGFLSALEAAVDACIEILSSTSGSRACSTSRTGAGPRRVRPRAPRAPGRPGDVDPGVYSDDGSCPIATQIAREDRQVHGGAHEGQPTQGPRLAQGPGGRARQDARRPCAARSAPSWRDSSSTACPAWSGTCVARPASAMRRPTRITRHLEHRPRGGHGRRPRADARRRRPIPVQELVPERRAHRRRGFFSRGARLVKLSGWVVTDAEINAERTALTLARRTARVRGVEIEVPTAAGQGMPRWRSIDAARGTRGTADLTTVSSLLPAPSPGCGTPPGAQAHGTRLVRRSAPRRRRRPPRSPRRPVVLAPIVHDILARGSEDRHARAVPPRRGRRD